MLFMMGQFTEDQMSNFKALMIGSVLLSFTGVARAGSVMVRPGQCVIVGTTEVCASLPTADNCAQAKEQAKADHIFSCRYDLHPHPEMPGLKSYALVRTTVNEYGKKTDVIIKNFGISDKAGCEAAAEKKN
jgi:hypothetical protein